MTHPTATIKKPSQNDILESVLLNANGAWVPWSTLHETSGAAAINSRMADLRNKRKHTVDCKTERNPRTGNISSYYRIPRPEQTELL